ncbi:hypothetical protein B0H10DRAFT_2197327 [Mycena sp. CBHHK59/15]|nr:hypothetical protein B0H10DRAFT_2197327 [Mycena sp. CBHHK59/15]
MTPGLVPENCLYESQDRTPACLIPHLALDEQPRTPIRHGNPVEGRQVRFESFDNSVGSNQHIRLPSPPPPYDSDDEPLDVSADDLIILELQLDVAIAEEVIWSLEWEVMRLKTSYWQPPPEFRETAAEMEPVLPSTATTISDVQIR